MRIFEQTVSNPPVTNPTPDGGERLEESRLTWKSVLPTTVFKLYLRQTFLSLVPGTLGVAFMLSTCCGLIYFVIQTVNPGLLATITAPLSIPLHRAAYIWPILALVAIAFVAYEERSKTCSVSASGLTVSSGRYPKHWAWNECLGYQVKDSGHEYCLVFILFLTDQPAQTFFIPRQRCAEIVCALDAWIRPLEVEPPPVPPDTPETDWKSLLAYFVLTLAFSLGEACLLADHASKWVAGICVLGAIFIGPGTFSCLVLHPKKFWALGRRRALLWLSFIFNWLGLSVLAVLFAVITIHRI